MSVCSQLAACNQLATLPGVQVQYPKGKLWETPIVDRDTSDLASFLASHEVGRICGTEPAARAQRHP